MTTPKRTNLELFTDERIEQALSYLKSERYITDFSVGNYSGVKLWNVQSAALGLNLLYDKKEVVSFIDGAYVVEGVQVTEFISQMRGQINGDPSSKRTQS